MAFLRKLSAAGSASLGLYAGYNATSASSEGSGGRVSTAEAQRRLEQRLTTLEALDKAGTGSSILDAIGNTPLIELKSLSAATGRRIFAKCEHLNPGGSIKDRAAKQLIETAEKQGLLKPGSRITEGTGGNTGIGLALVANAKGYPCTFAMPASIAVEKIELMKTLGAEVGHSLMQ
jgi:cysteine synthase A